MAFVESLSPRERKANKIQIITISLFIKNHYFILSYNLLTTWLGNSGNFKQMCHFWNPKLYLLLISVTFQR